MKIPKFMKKMSKRQRILLSAFLFCSMCSFALAARPPKYKCPRCKFVQIGATTKYNDMNGCSPSLCPHDGSTMKKEIWLSTLLK